MRLPKEYVDSRDLSNAVLAKARRAFAMGLYIEAAQWYETLDNHLTKGEALPEDWQSVSKSSGQRY